MATTNPFAFLLQKPRASLDRPFYAAAKRFQDLDDEMWNYLLALIPKGRGTYEKRTLKMLGTLSPELRNYFLVRSFDSEWGSGGMESALFFPPIAIQLPSTVLAFRHLGAEMHADLMERAVQFAQPSPEAGAETELAPLHERLQPLDDEWQRLAKRENFYLAIFNDIKRDVRPYLHPPEPQSSAPDHRSELSRSTPHRRTRGT